MDAILVQLHLSQNVASIGSLEDELCTPKPAKLDAWIGKYNYAFIDTFVYIYNHIHQEADFFSFSVF